jgi:hypothetical protein
LLTGKGLRVPDRAGPIGALLLTHGGGTAHHCL